jgi:hypothetical protein
MACIRLGQRKWRQLIRLNEESRSRLDPARAATKMGLCGIARKLTVPSGGRRAAPGSDGPFAGAPPPPPAATAAASVNAALATDAALPLIIGDDPDSSAILSKLSGSVLPVIVAPGAEATVNLSAVNPSALPSPGAASPSPSPYCAFGRRSSAAAAAAAPDPLAPAKLEWTASRMVLEAAIAIEQQAPGTSPFDSSAPAWRDDLVQHERRLDARLRRLGLEALPQAPDGACQFRSLAAGLFGAAEADRYHRRVRAAAVAHLAARRADFEGFVGSPREFDAYLAAMAQPATWGDELTLRAACESFQCAVNVVSSDAEAWFVRYVPGGGAAVRRELFVAYIAPLHYDALRRRRGGGAILRSLSSLGRRDSRVLRALDLYLKPYN